MWYNISRLYASTHARDALHALSLSLSLSVSVSVSLSAIFRHILPCADSVSAFKVLLHIFSVCVCVWPETRDCSVLQILRFSGDG